MVVGIGIDIIETERIRALMDKNEIRFLHRWFGNSEIEYCRGKAKPHLHFAARLAAKEAVFKALRLRSSSPICWKDIVVERDNEAIPRISLFGLPKEEAERLGITAVHLSLSHCDAYAVASVVAERSESITAQAQ